MIRKFLFILVFTFILATPAYAAIGIDPRLYPEGSPTISGEKPEFEKVDDSKVIAGPEMNVDKSRVLLTQRVVNFLFGIAGIVAIYFIVSNAWWLIASAGNEEKVTEHKKGLMWAVVGLVLVILSYSIIRFIISIPFQAHQEPAAAKPAAAAPK